MNFYNWKIMKSPNLFLKFVLLLTSGLCCYSFLSASTTINYTYDAAGRLIGADYGGRATISYAYDANGNLLKRQQVSGTAIRLPVNDFDNDGKSDVVLQRSNLVASGQAMDGRSNSSGNPVSLILGSGQVQLLGVADMDRNGTSDLIVRRLDGSNVHEVKLRNASGAVTLTRTYNPGGVDWRIVGLYDQNKDTHYDLIWQNSRTGQVVIWYLNASGARSSVVTFVTSMDDYRIVAVGDMNGDGHMDLLWQKVTGTTTQIVAWYLNAAGQRLPSGGTKVIGSVTGGYRCVGLGDYNSDGVLDILWQQADNQRIALWHMNTSGVRIGDAVVLPVGGIGQYVAHWQWEFEMQSVHSDINGDGVADIALQRSRDLVAVGQAMNGSGGKMGNTINLIAFGARVQVVGVASMNQDNTGDLIVRRLDGSNIHEVRLRNASGAVTATRTYNPGGADWRMVGVYDQNKDGNRDLIWQNMATGQVMIWYLNASGVRTSFATLVASMADYRIVGVGDMNGDGHMDLLWQKVTGTTTQIVAWYLNAAGQRLASGGTKVLGTVTGSTAAWGLETTTATGCWTSCGSRWTRSRLCCGI
jgi:YD repeat-containing protein